MHICSLTIRAQPINKGHVRTTVVHTLVVRFLFLKSSGQVLLMAMTNMNPTMM